MSFFNNLGYNVTDGVVTSSMSMGNNWLQGVLGISGKREGQKIEYYYNYQPGASFILTHTAPILRASAQYAKECVMNELKKFLKGKTQGREESAWVSLIQDYANVVQKKHYGMLQVNRDSGNEEYIPAINTYGEFCPEAFIMGIKLENPISYSVSTKQRGGTNKTGNYATVGGHYEVGENGVNKFVKDTINTPATTDMLVWFDPIAIPQINSDKNVLLTPVQGRDFTRKEIVGNGDIKFSVTGKMVSGVPGVYPEAEVKKFKQIMDYKGLVYCNHYILDILGIDKFIITGWSLSPRQGFADNEQDYSFSAVGVMPDKETKVEADTISIIDYRIQEEEKKNRSMWAQLVQKKLEGLQNAALDTMNKAADKGINSLIGLL